MSYIMDMLNLIDTASGKKEGFFADQPDNCIVGHFSGGINESHFGGVVIHYPEVVIQVRNLTYEDGLVDVYKVRATLKNFSGANVKGVVQKGEVRGLGKDSSGRSGFELRYKIIEKE
jgi:hypothetical protein